MSQRKNGFPDFLFSFFWLKLRGKGSGKRVAKRGRKKKTKVDRTNLQVIGLIVLSILLGVLIYTNSGELGHILTPILGGIFGPIKYVLPVGVFFVGLYTAYGDRDYLIRKLVQFALLIVCIQGILSVYQISVGNIPKEVSIGDAVERGYYLGTENIGGGAIGTLVAATLSKFIGEFATVIVCLGVACAVLVFLLKMNPAEHIADWMDERRERNDERREARKEERYRKNRKETEKILADMEEDRPETKRERRLREKEEAKKAALEVDDQLIINLDDKEEQEQKTRKIFKHGKDDIVPLDRKDGAKEEKPEFIENNLFKQEQETKEEKVKEVLQLEHTMTVEDEHYEFPPVTLLSPGESKGVKGGKKAVTDTAAKLQKTLYSFGVSAKVENVSVGPAITRYELKPAEGVRVSKIANLADDIALNLAAETIRIEAPIPGKQAVGIEIPNKENEVVHFRDIIETEDFINHKSKLAFALGKDVAGNALVTDIAKMPHVLIAGATGSGKSVCINTLIASIIYKAKPSEVKLVMVDPKVVELSVYNGIPHLLIPVVTDPKKAAGALAWAVQEMVNRYSLFASKNVRDIKGYNEALDKEGGMEKLPQIVIIIDELSDLMMVSPKDVEDAICRLAQMARAAGMHLVIATQRPSVDVITGIIKANIPSRIAFSVSSQVDSRTILDMAGAEKLLGKGDMLFYPAGAPKPVRVQGAFINDKEVEKIVDFLKANGDVTYNEEILEKIEQNNAQDADAGNGGESDDDDTDPFLMDAIEVVVETGQASTSFIQRRFKVGYARAGRIIDQMEERGIISGYQGSKPREVLMSKERWAELKMQAEESTHE